MKSTIYNIVSFSAAGVAAATLLSGCFEQKDFFDDSASLRIEHYNDDVQATLVAPDKGWVMQYFANDESRGYNIFCRFYNSEKVLLASDHEYLPTPGVYTELSSLYELSEEDGPILAFNSWNDILSVFTDPVDPSTHLKDGEGLKGDCNFNVKSCSASEIILRGERHTGEVRLIPCDRDWQEYIAAAAKTTSDIFNSSITSYYVIVGTDTLYATGMNTGIFTIGERIVDPLVYAAAPFVATPTGLRFESSFSGTSGNTWSHSVHELTVMPDSTGLVSEDGGVKFLPNWDAYIASHTAIWQMDTTAFTAEMLDMFHQMDAALTSYNANYSLSYIGVGTSGGKNSVNGIIFGVQTNPTKGTISPGGIKMNKTRDSFGVISYVADSTAMNGNMTTFCTRSAAFAKVATCFTALFEGQYSITPNDYFLPTGAAYTSTGGGANFLFK